MTDSSSVRNRGEGAELALLYPLLTRGYAFW